MTMNGRRHIVRIDNAEQNKNCYELHS